MTTKQLGPPAGRVGATGAATPTGSAPGGATPRPLVLVATLGGVAAALAPLVVCLALGVVGWFLVDSGAHGTSDDGLRFGALAWLTAHGTGVDVLGTPVTLVPLGLTLVVALVTWRIGLRTGEALASHGPDADRLGDGERDLTVPLAAGLFVAGYLVVAVVTVVLATDPSGPQAAPTPGRSVLGAVVVAALLGAPAIAVGSGRAAVWAGLLPVDVVATAAACARVVLGVALTSLLVTVVAVLVAADDVVNVFSLLHTGAAEAVTMAVVAVAMLPNAAAYAASWLLGPGFAVGTQTVVSPSAVVLGPVPMFPLLGALPGGGTPPGWTIAALGVLPLAAAVAVARSHRRHPTTRWDRGALRGCCAGVLAGVVVALACWLAGGALGTARMSEIGPAATAVLLHAVPALAAGGLVGGLVATWRSRRTAV